MINQIYITDNFAKRLGNINNDSYSIIGFHAYIVSIGVNTDINVLNHLNLINNFGNRIYHTDVDFYNIDYKTEELLLTLRIRNTAQMFTNASHIIYAYETIPHNEPIQVNEYGISFTPGLFNDSTELNSSNIAFVVKWYDDFQTSSLLNQITTDESIRLLINLHQYRINTNLLSVHIPDGMDHSHGLFTLKKSELALDENFDLWSLKVNNSQDRYSIASSVGLSPLVSLINDKIADSYIIKDNQVVYEDWNDSIESNYGEK